MSALAFLLLVLGLLGLVALLYYGLLCYPVIAQKSKPPTYDVEKRYLLPLGTDLNENSEASLAAPVVVPPTAAEAKRREALNESYPSAPNSSQSPHEDDSFGSPDVSQDITGSRQRLDEPDCAIIPIVKMSSSPVSQGKEPNRSGPGESVPLLHGDEEDGLILCQPSARSKNTGEPIPPVETVVYPSGQTTDIPQKENELPCKSNRSSISVPVDVQYDPSHTSSENQLPDHVTVTISEPMKVPPQENMSVSHPPSHMIVTIPQPLNAPPLMVAPIYDEPSIDQSPASLQQPLHSIVVPVSVIPPPIELETYQEPTPHHQSDAYGWKDEVEVPVATNLETEADQPQKFSCAKPFTQEPNQEVVVVLPTTTLPSAPDLEPTSPDVANDNSCDSSNTSSNASPEVSPRSKGSCTLSESSEPELSEYTFESGRLCPTTITVLENEISSVSNVQILRYTKIDDSLVLEADASISDSLRVLVGDPVDPDDLQTESQEDNDASCEVSPDPHEESSVVIITSCLTPDLAIARRSPDGDSMKSHEGESSVGNSPKKNKEQEESNVEKFPQIVEHTVDVPAKVL